MNDVFCEIVRGEIPTEFVYQDEDVVAFNDVHPSAPVHILIVPRKHIESVRDARDEDALILGKLLLAAKKVAEKVGVDKTGYKLVINNGAGAGQVVPHLHMHLLGGGVF